jgi:hypothetical protein
MIKFSSNKLQIIKKGSDASDCSSDEDYNPDSDSEKCSGSREPFSTELRVQSYIALARGASIQETIASLKQIAVSSKRPHLYARLPSASTLSRWRSEDVLAVARLCALQGFHGVSAATFSTDGTSEKGTNALSPILQSFVVETVKGESQSMP